MTLRTKIAVVAATLFLGGCQELPGYFASDTTLARAGGSELKMRDVESVVPKGVTGEDSAAFMKVYIDRWVRKQLKLQEAEILFSASADDIDKMVEEYRQALLIRKLDQHYVDRSIDTTFTENEIAAYYNAHKADFRLDRTLVKGRIVQFGEGYRQARKLRELMGTKSEARQQDFRDICAKNDFTVTDFSDQWVDFPEFLRPGARIDGRAGDARQPFALLFPDRRRAPRRGAHPARTAAGDDPPHPLQPAPERDHPQPRGGTL